MIRNFIILIIWVGICWFLTHTLVIILDGVKDEVAEVDVIIVLGNKVNEDRTVSDRLKSRLDKSIEIYNQGKSSNILVSGATGKEGHNEAEVMQEYLVENGIPGEHIHVDGMALNTYQTAENAKEIMEFNGWESALVVSNYYHITRTKLAFDMFDIKPSSAHADFIEVRDFYSVPREFFGYYGYLLKY
ncbi:YdcF family protein [Patescibacteria group bacterium]